jgi:hypothetical protein
MGDRTLLRLCLVGTYFVLALGVNVLLLEHELSAHGPSAHPDQDVCAWLDHAGGVSLQSDPPALATLPTCRQPPAPAPALPVVNAFRLHSVRGPPTPFI